MYLWEPVADVRRGPGPARPIRFFDRGRRVAIRGVSDPGPDRAATALLAVGAVGVVAGAFLPWDLPAAFSVDGVPESGVALGWGVLTAGIGVALVALRVVRGWSRPLALGSIGGGIVLAAGGIGLVVAQVASVTLRNPSPPSPEAGGWAALLFVAVAGAGGCLLAWSRLLGGFAVLLGVGLLVAVAPVYTGTSALLWAPGGSAFGGDPRTRGFGRSRGEGPVVRTTPGRRRGSESTRAVPTPGRARRVRDGRRRWDDRARASPTVMPAVGHDTHGGVLPCQLYHTSHRTNPTRSVCRTWTRSSSGF